MLTWSPMARQWPAVSRVMQLSLPGSHYCLLFCVCRTWSQHMPGRVFTPCVQETWQFDARHGLKSKTSSCFPNFDASNAWQMSQKSREGFFLGKNCSWTLLPGSIWLQIPINRLYSAAFEVPDHILIIWNMLMTHGVCKGFLMPLNHQAGIQGSLKIS